MAGEVYLGNFADIDPDESDTNAENAADLVGLIFEGPSDMQIVDVTKYDTVGTSPTLIGDNDSNGANSGGDHISYDLGSGTVTTDLDSTIEVFIRITLQDGTLYSPTGSGTLLRVTLIQSADGDVFLSDVNNTGYFDGLAIKQIEITGLYSTNLTGWDISEETTGTTIVCFAHGTSIKTQTGDVFVEDLAQDDMVLTADNGYQPIRWIGSTEVSAATLEENTNLHPVRIRAGALGENTPSQDLLVSPQHRVLVRSKIAERMFGESEVLLPAKSLVVLDGIDVANDFENVRYFHFLFDQHQIVYSNGAETESLYTGPEALKSVSPEGRLEILTLFPELNDINYVTLSARKLIKGRIGRKIAIRHKNNNRPLVAVH